MPERRASAFWHVAQRPELAPWAALGYRLAAVLAALAAGGGFLLALGYNPLGIYASMLSGALGSAAMQKETIKLVVPLCLASLGVTLAFRMRFWNIGAEGQICAGAIAASYFAYRHSALPPWLLLSVMAAASVLAGGLYGLVPAYFKARFGTNETLFTLMLNYIAIYVITWLREGPWRNPEGGFAAMPRFPKAARLPELPFPGVGNVHLGWVVALAAVVLSIVYLKHTKHGYEITVVGENEATARYAGLPVRRIVLRTVFLSAAVCGLTGMLQVAGSDRQLTDAVAGGRGFAAVSVSWLARLSPGGILVVSSLFSVLQKGCSMMQTQYRIPSSMSEVLQGIILFFVLGAEFFLHYRIVRGKDALP